MEKEKAGRREYVLADGKLQFLMGGQGKPPIEDDL